MHIKNIALGLALSFSVGAAHAATLFDNININPAGLDWGGNGIRNVSTNTQSFTPVGPIAASFFAPTATTLSSITLRLSTDEVSPVGSIMVYLVPDDGSMGFGNAGAATSTGSGATFAFTGAQLLGSISEALLTDEPANYTLSTSLSISSGVHWIAAVADNDSEALWWYNQAGVGDAIGSANQRGQDQFFGNFAFADGSYEMIVQDAPEPASLAILGAALAGVGYFSRRRRSV